MEILTTDEMARADQLTIAAGTPGFELMRAAGRAVADAANEMAEEGPILVVAGRGNNGGDGFVAAAELAAQGRDVSVILLCDRATLKGDAALAAKGWKGEVLPCDPSLIGAPALIIDALFGAGLDRPVKGDPLIMIDAINAAGVPVLAVDLPSGINGNSGAVMGGAVQAQRDGDLLPAQARPSAAARPGALRPAAGDRYRHRRRRCSARSRPQTFENNPDLWADAFPVPKINSHKFSRGHAVVVSGDIAATGAARLAARGGAARRRRPGHGGVAARCAGGQCRGADGGDGAAGRYDGGIRRTDRRQGHGLRHRPGRRHRRADPRLRRRPIFAAKRHAVLDADALTSFADAPEQLFGLIKADPEAGVVLTPHEGEFSSYLQ